MRTTLQGLEHIGSDPDTAGALISRVRALNEAELDQVAAAGGSRGGGVGSGGGAGGADRPPPPHLS